MSARHKLNVAFLNGALLVAGVLGLGSQSWAVFLIALALLIASGVYMGEIRPKARH